MRALWRLREWLARWSLRRRVAAMLAALLALVAVVFTIASIAEVHLDDALTARIDRIAPARLGAEALLRDVLAERTDTLSAAILDRPSDRQDYARAVADEQARVRQVARLLVPYPDLAAELAATEALAARWRQARAAAGFAAAARGVAPRLNPAVTGGTPSFTEVNAAATAFVSRLSDRTNVLAVDVQQASSTLRLVLVAGGVLALTGGAAVLVLQRRWVSRPISALRDDISTVAAGELRHPIAIAGPPEIAEVGEDADAMRRRLVAELEHLHEAREEISRQADELRRSNSDLEQFAYVASHDLQEPLRKVASFCDLLERRYGDQLDERGRQYVALAADGARRMQDLVRDVLTLARVGRRDNRHAEVDLNEALRSALANLSEQVRASSAVVEHPALPTVPGDPSLVVALLQNLLANSIKFRGPEPPEITITAERHDDGWEFTFADNGIGIDPAYAERVFVLFQRLHRRDQYSGTGIGLALCRRIVEFHGGHMWLDTSVHSGATFRWTWPAQTAERATRNGGKAEATVTGVG